MANPTMQKFGWPGTRIAELDHWAVVLRPQQVTAGALVVICKEPVNAFSEVSPEGFAELQKVVSRVERTLKATVGYQKINWLMLMMMDPDVHFHVLPRYEGARALGGAEVEDAGWPAQPRLDRFVEPDPAIRDAMIAELSAAWGA